MKKIKLLIPLFLLASCTSNTSSIINSNQPSENLSSIASESSQSEGSIVNQTSDIELISFSLENNVNNKNSKKRANNVVTYETGTTNVSLLAVVKNNDRASFLDVEMYIQSLDTRVIYNEGNGNYQCVANTVFDNDLQVWVTEIRFDFSLKYQDQYVDQFEIKAINFINHQTNKIQAKIPDNVSPIIDVKYTYKLAIESITASNITNEYYIGSTIDFRTLYDVNFLDNYSQIKEDWVNYEILSGNNLLTKINENQYKANLVGDVSVKVSSKYNDSVNYVFTLNIGDIVNSISSVNQISRAYINQDFDLRDFYKVSFNSKDSFIKEDYVEYDIVSGGNLIEKIDEHNYKTIGVGTVIFNIKSKYDNSINQNISIEIIKVIKDIVSINKENRYLEDSKIYLPSLYRIESIDDLGLTEIEEECTY